MKKYLGALLFCLGIGMLVGKVFKEESNWLTYLVAFLIIGGMSIFIVFFEKDIKDEIIKELDK